MGILRVGSEKKSDHGFGELSLTHGQIELGTGTILKLQTNRNHFLTIFQLAVSSSAALSCRSSMPVSFPNIMCSIQYLHLRR
jgi:hypothetical protein